MPRQNTKLLSFFDKIKYLFLQPTFFFSHIKSEPIWKSLVFYVIISLFVSVIQSLFSSLMRGLMMYNSQPWAGSLFGIHSYSFFLIFFGIFVFLSFCFALLVHLFVHSFQRRGKLKDTYNIVMYSLGITTIFSLIPLVGLFSLIYAIILMIIGVSTIHSLSRERAVAAVVIPVFLFLFLLAGIILFFAFRSFYGF